MNEKALLSVKETASYLGLGLTKTREIMKENEHKWVVTIGRRHYSNKELLDKWLRIRATD